MESLSKRIGRYASGRMLVAIGCVSLGAAVLATVVTVLAKPADVFPWLAIDIALFVVGILALVEAPQIEAALLVDQALRQVETGQFTDALPRLNRAIRLSPRMARAYIARCAAYAGTGQLDLAVADAEQAVKVAPRQTESRLLRARLYIHRGLYEEAIRDLQTGLHDNPGWTDGYLELAQVQIQVQHYEGGLATLRDLSFHTASERTRYDALMMAGWIYEEKLNDLDSAIASYTRAIPILPDRKVGYLRRAYAYRSRGDLYQTAEDLLRAAQRPPMLEDVGRYHWLRAACYGRRFTITQDERDLAAWIAALEQSIREDNSEFSEQSRQWLQALQDTHRRDEALRIAQSGPPPPRIFPN